jgi:hypothetical protein
VIRRFSYAGTCRFRTRQLFRRDTLLQEDSALEETADGLWSIDFSDVLLARLAEWDFTRYVWIVSLLLPVSTVTDAPGCYTPMA